MFVAYNLGMKGFFGYFVGWPGTWERLRGKTLLGLIILAGLWLCSAILRDLAFITHPLRGLGDTAPGLGLADIFSYLLMLLVTDASHFLAFVGLFCLVAWAARRGEMKEILGASAWSWIVMIPLNIVLSGVALASVNWASLDTPAPAWQPLVEGAARWLLQPSTPLAPWLSYFSPVSLWAMVIFGGFASRIFRLRWPWGLAIGPGAWLAWAGLRFLMYLPFFRLYH